MNHPTTESTPADLDPCAKVRIGSDGSRIDQANVYFAFPSGRLGYDCQICQAKCCRGFHYTLAADEISKHAQLYPLTRLFSVAEALNHVTVNNHPPGCFFLTPDNLCRIQSTHGTASKPELCRLFPFSRLMRVEDYIVVGPHPGLCPLEVMATQTCRAESNHAHLLDDLTTLGIDTPIQRRFPIIGTARQLVELERSITLLVDSYLEASTYLQFADRQAAEAAAVFGFEGPIQSSDVLVGQMTDILGIRLDEVLQPDIEATRALIVSTPSLRADLVFLNAPVQTRRAVPLALQHLHNALLATYILLRAARLLGMHKITYQTVSSLFVSSADLIELMALLGAKVCWPPGTTVDLTPVSQFQSLRYAQIAQSLTAPRQRRHRKSLYAILTAALPEGVQRVEGVKQVARCTYQRLVDIPQSKSGAAGRRVSQLSRLKGSIQQWAIDQLPVPVLSQLSAGLTKRVTGRSSHAS